ncbi:hypothetical protein ACFYXS_05035 [Streptomyces sp. NPDC002574]|uniref:hypothetical protein n=1 Tax=Streptomyces sp. NPDC002574 TaxID=3364652 RepID=UPI0036AEA536
MQRNVIKIGIPPVGVPLAVLLVRANRKISDDEALLMRHLMGLASGAASGDR